MVCSPPDQGRAQVIDLLRVGKQVLGNVSDEEIQGRGIDAELVDRRRLHAALRVVRLELAGAQRVDEQDDDVARGLVDRHDRGTVGRPVGRERERRLAEVIPRIQRRPGPDQELSNRGVPLQRSEHQQAPAMAVGGIRTQRRRHQILDRKILDLELLAELNDLDAESEKLVAQLAAQLLGVGCVARVGVGVGGRDGFPDGVHAQRQQRGLAGASQVGGRTVRTPGPSGRAGVPALGGHQDLGPQEDRQGLQIGLVYGCLYVVGAAALVLVVPLILPVAAGYDVNPVHLGIIFLTNLQIGYCTPPVGLNLFLASYRFKRPILELYRATLPFLGLLLITLVLITYFPWLSLALVEWLG